MGLVGITSSVSNLLTVNRYSPSALTTYDCGLTTNLQPYPEAEGIKVVG
jgi:hypothetical protein